MPRWDYMLEISEHAVSSKTEINILTRQQSPKRLEFSRVGEVERNLRLYKGFYANIPRCCSFSRAYAIFWIRRVFESGLFQYFRGGIRYF